MIIKIENLQQLVADGDKIMLEPGAEEVLAQILDLEKKITDAKTEIKEKLRVAALALNPNFKSIQGDKIKVAFQSYGARYKIDESLINTVPKEFYETKISYSPNGDVIEQFANEHKGGLPMGVIEVDRPKQISFSLKNSAKTNE